MLRHASKAVLFGIDSGVAHIQLNRPEAGNALNLEMATELAAAAQACSADPDVRVVLLSAHGRTFCVGGDLKAIAALGEEIAPRLRELVDQLHTAVSIFRQMPAPLVIAVNGIAAGAGFSLALVGDLVVAAESAKFTLAYTAAGISPDGGATYHLPRLVGMRRAQELIYANRTLTAREALDWGLVTQVAPDDQLIPAVQALGKRLASGPRVAHAAVKALLRASVGNHLDEHLALECEAICRTAASADGVEGVKAFTERRAPMFL